jgi:hypothetical protein
LAKSPGRTERRAARRGRRQLRRKILRYLAVVGIALLGVIIIAGLILPSVPGFGGPREASGPQSGDTPGETFPDQGRLHLDAGEAAPAAYYNSVPPTSGTHSPSWTRCGIFTSPLPEEIQVHNLEHGFILVQYNTEDQAIIDSLEETVKKLPSYPQYVILAPYPQMTQTIALTAWRVAQYLETVDEAAIRAFAGAYRGRGPELASGCEPGGFMEES